MGFGGGGFGGGGFGGPGGPGRGPSLGDYHAFKSTRTGASSGSGRYSGESSNGNAESTWAEIGLALLLTLVCLLFMWLMVQIKSCMG